MSDRYVKKKKNVEEEERQIKKERETKEEIQGRGRGGAIKKGENGFISLLFGKNMTQ